MGVFQFHLQTCLFFKGIFAFGGTPISCMEWENGSHKATACQCSALFLGVEKRTGHRDSQNTDFLSFQHFKNHAIHRLFQKFDEHPRDHLKVGPSWTLQGSEPGEPKAKLTKLAPKKKDPNGRNPWMITDDLPIGLRFRIAQGFRIGGM